MEMIDAKGFKSMMICAANNLYNNHKYVDSLNVFPVPDGDTGTNMNLTMMSGVNEISNMESDSASEIARAFSKGLLMGARGNSGVILSQIFKGIAIGVDHKEKIDTKLLCYAFNQGRDTAYKAVLNPVEGTILTVIKDLSIALDKYLAKNPDLSVEQALEYVIKVAKESLANTPNMLPALKEAGVVDSGGAGLIYILEGIYAGLKGNTIEKTGDTGEYEERQSSTGSAEEVEFGYCTEFIVRIKDVPSFDEAKVREELVQMGNSVAVVQDEEILKVHIHTLTPGDVLNYGQQFGDFVKLKIENMTEQHSNITAQEGAKKKPYAIISCCAGKGMRKIFNGLRAEHVVEGGNTMNPSTNDFIAAIKESNAETVYILPNNSNIVMAAKQAVGQVKGVKVEVIETKTIPQGVLACMMFNPEDTRENNVASMTEAISMIKTGQLTYAVRDTSANGFDIKKNDYIGVFGKDIAACSRDRYHAAIQMIEKMIDDDSGLLTVYVGAEGSFKEAKRIKKYVEDNYSLEVELKQGDQPVYYYIFSIE